MSKTASTSNQDKLRAWMALLGNTTRLKKEIERRLAREFGLSLSRFDVLAALERGGKDGLRAGELTRLLVVSDGNTTQVTDKLVRDGMVVRKRDEGDGRIVIYALTEDGRALFKRMADANRKWVTRAFDGFDTQDLNQLRALLGKIDFSFPEEQDKP